MNSFAAVATLLFTSLGPSSTPGTLDSSPVGYEVRSPARFSTADLPFAAPASVASVSSREEASEPHDGGAVGNGNGSDEEKAGLGAVAGQSSGLSGAFDPSGGASGMMAFDAGGGASGMVAFDDGLTPTGLGSLDDALGLGRKGSQGATPMLGHLDAGGGAAALGR